MKPPLHSLRFSQDECREAGVALMRTQTDKRTNDADPNGRITASSRPFGSVRIIVAIHGKSPDTRAFLWHCLRRAQRMYYAVNDDAQVVNVFHLDCSAADPQRRFALT